MKPPLLPENIETPGNVLIGAGLYGLVCFGMIFLMWAVTRK